MNQNTLQQLQNRANDVRGSRMPSLRQLHELLNQLGVEHEFTTSRNVVSSRLSSGRSATVRYGRSGNALIVRNENSQYLLDLDNSDSYYSVNSWNNARQLVSLLEERGLL